jgi:uncharacterized damage-inducible protein DinB
MDPRIPPLTGILRTNTKLFGNCLDGLTEEAARVRPSGTTNSATFVAAHLAESRFYTLKVLGAERPNPLARYLGEWRAIEEITEWPSLAQIRSAWAEATAALEARLAAITTAELNAPSGTQMPIEDRSLLGLFAFMLQHDSYHVGQLSLLRKYAGLPAMSYS